ncbi:hypothetical protein BBOU_0181 [Bifidobacterium boum]|uniref:Uncharacterized protein n=1 Tax=Bifidobacterium boum TaxID=78343 RepID=A0A086ZRD5_9BIFI|nr:hypothetical protein BBOU_0181 [Bifidobacterium boum]
MRPYGDAPYTMNGQGDFYVLLTMRSAPRRQQPGARVQSLRDAHDDTKHDGHAERFRTCRQPTGINTSGTISHNITAFNGETMLAKQGDHHHGHLRMPAAGSLQLLCTARTHRIRATRHRRRVSDGNRER